jgi:hypothetical protein
MRAFYSPSGPMSGQELGDQAQDYDALLCTLTDRIDAAF